MCALQHSRVYTMFGVTGSFMRGVARASRAHSITLCLRRDFTAKVMWAVVLMFGLLRYCSGTVNTCVVVLHWVFWEAPQWPAWMVCCYAA